MPLKVKGKTMEILITLIIFMAIVGIYFITRSAIVSALLERAKPFTVVVESETEWIVDRNGKDRVLKEGIQHFVPFLDKREAIVSLKEFKIDPKEQKILTQDNINIHVDMIAMGKVIDSMKAIQGVEKYKESIKKLVETKTFTKLSQLNFVDIQKNGKQLSEELIALIEEDSLRWGIKLMQVEFESITPPDSIKDAMEKEIVAEKEKKSAILKAEGEHKVHELHADSEKIMIEKRAEATHKVIKDLKALMPDISDEKIMHFLTSTSYIDSMKELSASKNSKFVLYPTDTQQPMQKIMGAEYMSRTPDEN